MVKVVSCLKYNKKYASMSTLQPKTKEKQPAAKAVTPEKEKIEETKEEEEAPPLPARTRRLPSIPSQERISYEPREEHYDEEGLYHRIEDIKAQREYQNCQVRSAAEAAKAKKYATTINLIQETYDDVEGVTDRFKEPTETYDDVHSVAQSKIKHEPISYDDVQVNSDYTSLLLKLNTTYFYNSIFVMSRN